MGKVSTKDPASIKYQKFNLHTLMTIECYAINAEDYFSGLKAVFHEDYQFDKDSEKYFYPFPCGDNFSITKEDLENGEDVAMCPSCSFVMKVIYDKGQFVCRETVPAPSTNKELVKC
ncbi:DPH3 homolog [Mus pahari]|uniref:DPH3 homolog n=1 Tax=Mus pahari TaxID=10093 RepID=UPI000A313A0C|nr:DPH3 homolog [Mus pahari]